MPKSKGIVFLLSVLWGISALGEERCEIAHLPARADSPWRSSLSANFHVHAYGGEDLRSETLVTCETLRRELSRKWAGRELPDWSVPCHIVLHPTQASYERAVGPQLAGTNGASSVEFDRRQATKVKLRRLDLVCDASQTIAALAHELTHVLLIDWCDGRPPPRWFDEGLALLADSRDKQRLHVRDLQAAFANGTSFRITELIALEGYPRQQRIPAFYAQSLVLVRWLSERGEPAKLLEFHNLGEERGYDAALRELYEIDGLAELEQLWQTHCETLLATR